MKSAKDLAGFAGGALCRLSKGDSRKREALAFLPAALEIVDTPPSPTGRLIGITIIVLFCVALGWASFGHVDIIASAAGKVIPSGRVKIVQPFETGVVRAIDVHDGQRVKAGDALIELDPTITTAEAAHVKSDLLAARLDIARLRSALTDRAFEAPAGASQDQINMERAYLVKQTEAINAKLAALDGQMAQKQAERNTTAAMIDKLEAEHPIISQRVEIRKSLADRELGSKITFLENLQELTNNEKDTSVQRSKLAEADAAIVEISDTKTQAVAEFHRSLLADLAEADRKAAGLVGDLAKAEERSKLQTLTAPVDGIVQQLSVHTIGGVVTPAQQLAVVVPSDSILEVEAMISNRDIGFVRSGQDVQIKFDAFNFTRYGVLRGKVLSVSQDAVVHDVSPRAANSERAGTADSESEPKGQELNYVARISLEKTEMEVDRAPASIIPGMAVTVEIKTGARSVLSYLLSPLLRYTNDSLHER